MLEEEASTGNPNIRQAIYEAFGGKCFYSGRPLDFNEFHIDHVVPRAKGGKDEIENYVLCSPDVNTKKSSKNLAHPEVTLDLISQIYAPKVKRKLHHIVVQKNKVR